MLGPPEIVLGMI